MILPAVMRGLVLHTASLSVFEHKSADRANGNTLATVLATGPTYRLISKSGDHPPEATVSKTNDSFAQFFLAYPNASAAKHTFIRIVSVQGAARIYGELRQDFPEPFCFEVHVEMLGYPLKFARTTFWTMGAIHRLASQE
jgi:hypothetical protein